MIKKTTIIVADDHPMLLKGLTDELSQNGFNVIETAINGTLALEKIITLQPDIAILDIEMPYLTAFEVIKKCHVEKVKTKFIILTSHKDSRYVYKAKTLHISGYLLKDEPFEELQKCITEVIKGSTYFSKSFTSVFEAEISPGLEKIKLLSPSERTILRFIAQEKGSKDIAKDLSISIRTVQKHRTNIIAKLNLASHIDTLNTWANDHKDIILSF